jgi:transcriptional regulator with XRE-family HTH domain
MKPKPSPVEAREAKRLTQTQLCVHFDLSPGTICKFECDKLGDPHRGTRAKLARAYGQTIQWVDAWLAREPARSGR